MTANLLLYCHSCRSCQTAVRLLSHPAVILSYRGSNRYALAEIAQRVRYQASRVQRRRRLRQCGDLKKGCNSPRPHAAQHEASCVGRARACAQKTDQPARQMLRNGAVTSVRSSVGDASLCSSKLQEEPNQHWFGRNATSLTSAFDTSHDGAAPRGCMRVLRR